jgi:prepilin-type N-terminal cleavage/methylation domain-containing protein
MTGQRAGSAQDAAVSALRTGNPDPARRVVRGFLESAEAGVTLIELLIAVTLVAMLSTGMLFAVRAGLMTMEKSNSRLMANRRAASVMRILEAQVDGIMPVKTQCITAADSPAQIVPFFQGDQQALRFVSNYSLQEGIRGMPMILEFHVIGGENDAGVRLVVNEHIYTGPRSTGSFCAGLAPNQEGVPMPQFLPIQTSPNSFVLADKLAYCRFAYRFVPADPRLPALWLVHWPKPLLPNAIRIEMAPLVPDSARVQPIALTMPVHVTKDPMKTDYGY